MSVGHSPCRRAWLAFLVAWSIANGSAALDSRPPGSLIFHDALTNSVMLDGALVSPDQKIVVWGSFRTSWGMRLNATGEIDSSFHPDSFGAWNPKATGMANLLDVAFQADGKILVAGDFSEELTTPRRIGVFRCRSDGTLDDTFSPQLMEGTRVYGVRSQADGKVLLIGVIYLPDRWDRVSCARLLPDGALDPDFQLPDLQPGPTFLEIDPRGGCYLGGQTSQVNGARRNGLARLRSDGGLDTEFVPVLALAADSQFPMLDSVTPLPDGQVLVCGQFATAGGIPRANVMRLKANGLLDTSFDPGNIEGPPSGYIEAVRRTSKGQIIIAGSFTSVQGQTRRAVARLQPDGTLDTGFSAELPANFSLSSVELMEDDSLVILGTGGLFRLTNNETVPAPPVITGQPAMQSTRVGGPAQWSVAVASSSPPGFQWYHNGQPLASATNSQLVLGGVNLGDAGAYYVVVTNASGATTSDPATLEVASPAPAPGLADPSFNPGSGPNGTVRAMRIVEGGRILIAGDFTQYDGTARGRIARLLPDGQLDESFGRAGGFNAAVNAALESPEGGIVVAGAFTSLAGKAAAGVCRLNADGSLDRSFQVGTGLDGAVNSLARDPRGGWLVAGNFQRFAGLPTVRVARLRTDGTLDPGFRAAAPNGYVNCMVVQPDGRILIGGIFSVVGPATRFGLARLHPDGSLDEDFNPGWGVAGTELARSLALLADGSCMVGGTIRWANDERCFGMFKLDPFGGIDRSFHSSLGSPSNTSGQYAVEVLGITETADRGLYVGGSGFGHSYIGSSVARLQADGSLDRVFTTNTRGNGFGSVTAIATQEDGRLVVAGTFKEIGRLPRAGIARLYGGVGSPNESPVAVGVFNHGLPVTQKLSSPDRPTGVVVTNGQDLVWSSPVASTTPVQYQWHLDGEAVPGETNATFVLRNVHRAGARVRLWARNSTETTWAEDTYGLITETPLPGRPDTSFAGPAPVNGKILAVDARPDGKVLIGGSFVTLGGRHRPLVARLNDRGELEDFGPAWITSRGSVWSLARTTNGSVLLGGDFHALHTRRGETNSVLVRLGIDGEPDPAFRPRFDDNAAVKSLALAPDGRLAIGGSFSNIDGASHRNVALFRADGTLDPDFQAGTGGAVNDLAWNTDGTLVLVGEFTNVNQTAMSGVAVLNPTGQLDSTFRMTNAPDKAVRAVVILPDGGLLMGGSFQRIGTRSLPLLARLRRDGTVDPRFASPLVGDEVLDLLVQPDGQIVAGGLFDSRLGSPRVGIARMTAQGVIEASFDPGLGVTYPEGSGGVSHLALDSHGDVLVAGFFSHINGIHRARLARLFGRPPAPDGPRMVAGNFDLTARIGENVTISGDVESHSPLTFQWNQVGPASAPISGATNPALVLTRVTANQAGAYVLTATTQGGQRQLDPIRLFLNPAGAKAGLPDPVDFPAAGMQGVVHAVRRMPDGRLLVAGDSLRVAAGPPRALVRLSPMGELDDSMAGETPIGGIARCLVEVPGNGWLVGGRMVDPAGVNRSLLRIRADGLPDPVPPTDLTLDGTIWSLAVQPDGGWIAGGEFQLGEASSPSHLVRCDHAGRQDPQFTPTFDGPVRALALLPNGQLVVGGDFTLVNGQARTGLAVLQTDGALNQDVPALAFDRVRVNALLVAPDATVLAAGRFESTSNGSLASLLRIVPGLEPEAMCRVYRKSGIAGQILSLATNATGELLVGGDFTGIADAAPTNRPWARAGLARLGPTGSPDLSFDPGRGVEGMSDDAGVLCIVPESDGNWLIGGDFNGLAGRPHPALARIIGTNAPASLANLPPRFSDHYAPYANYAEGKTKSTRIFATDDDTPAEQLRFSFVGEPPTGMTIDAVSGIITWTPDEQQGPANYVVLVGVRDSSNPPLEATVRFDAAVSEINQPPVCAPVPPQRVKVGQTLTVPLDIADPDWPPNTVHAWLGRHLPAGSKLDDTTHVFTWTPTIDQAGTVVPIEIIISDGQSTGVTNVTFAVTVAEAGVSNSPPQFVSVPTQFVTAGEELVLALSAVDSDVPPQKLTYTFATTPPDGAAVDSESGIFRWRTSPDTPSATNEVRIRVEDDGTPPLADEIRIQVVVRNPVVRILEASLASPTSLRIVWTSRPGRRYRIQASDAVPSVAWEDALPVREGAGLTTSAELERAPEGVAWFFRIVEEP